MYKIIKEDLSEKVYQAIKEMILNNSISSGEKLNQEQLAEKLGVSRTPVLSAFSKLEKEMLLKLVPNKGAYVNKLTVKEFDDLLDLRLRLEPLGAFEAANKATPEQIGKLKKTFVNFEKMVYHNSDHKLKIADYHFHMTIMKISQNEMLYKMMSSFNIILISNINILVHDPSSSIEDHKNIFEAIKNHNGKQAEEAIYAHILRLKLRLLEEKKLF